MISAETKDEIRRLLDERAIAKGDWKMNQRKDDYMRGYGDGFKDGLAEARRRPEPNQSDMTYEADIRVLSDVQMGAEALRLVRAYRELILHGDDDSPAFRDRMKADRVACEAVIALA